MNFVQELVFSIARITNYMSNFGCKISLIIQIVTQPRLIYVIRPTHTVHRLVTTDQCSSFSSVTYSNDLFLAEKVYYA